MTKFFIKELHDLSKEEEAVRRHVLSNLHYTKPKRNYLGSLAAAIVSIAIIFLLVKVVDPTSSPQTGSLTAQLIEVKGDGVAYNQMFQGDRQSERELTYYKPLSLTEYTKYHPIQLTLPKTLEHLDHQEVIIVTSDEGMETQFTFKEEERSNSDFLVISVSNSINPYEQHLGFDTVTEDIFGNKIEYIALTEDIVILHDKQTTDSMYTYHYYNFREEENYIGITATSANWLYTYYKGNIYHIGYSPYSEILKPEDVVPFVKEFILENADSFANQNQPR